MNNSSYSKAASALGHHSKQQYGSMGGHSAHYMSGHAQHLGPTSHADGRIPKKGSAQPKHKVHGMNQSMDAGAERYQPGSHGLSSGFAGIKAARGDRQSLLGPDQHHGVQHQQHQNYMNNSYEPAQQ